jgi:hypothetical protein
MSLSSIFKFALFVIGIVLAILICVDISYNVKPVYFLYEYNECEFPNAYISGVSPDRDKNNQYFQKNFKHIKVKIYNEGKKTVEGIRIKTPFNGYYEIAGNKCYHLNKFIEPGNLPPSESIAVSLWTNDDIAENDIASLNIDAKGESAIPLWKSVTVYSGVYYWILTNKSTWEMIVLPATYLLTFLVGLLFGRWRNISLSVNA